MKPLPVAMQLYSVREELEKDFFGVLEEVKTLGYAGVEFAGYYGHTAEVVRFRMEKLGLKAVASHVALKAFDDDLGGVLDYHRELGVKYLVMPFLSEDLRPGTPAWPDVVKKLRKFGEACHEAGFQLAYHNHDFEFVRLGGETALDALFREVPMPFLATEIDVAWVKLVGGDPIAALKKYAGRAPVFHLKDFILTGSQVSVHKKTSTVDRSGFDFCPLGEGRQDIPGLLNAAQDAGVEWIIVEQDTSSDRPVLKAMAASRKYLKSLGY